MATRIGQSGKRGSVGRGFLVLLLGFAVGAALFTPWEKLCERLVQHVDSKLTNLNFTWQDLRRAGPSGFRIDELVVGFENSPGSLRFAHADLRFGFSPLARVRLDTGGDECHLNIYRSGLLEIEGRVNLTFLFGGGGVQGNLFAKGGVMPSEEGLLAGTGWLNLRSEKLVLPDGTVSEELNLTTEINRGNWIVKNVSMRKPVDFQGNGLAELNRESFPDSAVRLKGEYAIGDSFYPVEIESRLGDFLGDSNR